MQPPFGTLIYQELMPVSTADELTGSKQAGVREQQILADNRFNNRVQLKLNILRSNSFSPIIRIELPDEGFAVFRIDSKECGQFRMNRASMDIESEVKFDRRAVDNQTIERIPSVEQSFDRKHLAEIDQLAVYLSDVINVTQMLRNESGLGNGGLGGKQHLVVVESRHEHYPSQYSFFKVRDSADCNPIEIR